mmetsp:Transcript_8637/g.9813  ORF Transcript_8637/g.9813 Transcript_8637/m.9813 type:complete len:93 (+) Transcript_8637:97-375(+)
MELVKTSKSLNSLQISVSSIDHFEALLEALEHSRSLLSARIRVFTLTKAGKELMRSMKSHFKQFWHRNYLVNFDCHLKSFELKSHPFVELDF